MSLPARFVNPYILYTFDKFISGQKLAGILNHELSSQLNFEISKYIKLVSSKITKGLLISIPIFTVASFIINIVEISD